LDFGADGTGAYAVADAFCVGAGVVDIVADAVGAIAVVGAIGRIAVAIGAIAVVDVVSAGVVAICGTCAISNSSADVLNIVRIADSTVRKSSALCPNIVSDRYLKYFSAFFAYNSNAVAFLASKSRSIESDITR
jgi:hypothetical protein